MIVTKLLYEDHLLTDIKSTMPTPMVFGIPDEIKPKVDKLINSYKPKVDKPKLKLKVDLVSTEEVMAIGELEYESKILEKFEVKSYFRLFFKNGTHWHIDGEDYNNLRQVLHFSDVVNDFGDPEKRKYYMDPNYINVWHGVNPPSNTDYITVTCNNKS